VETLSELAIRLEQHVAQFFLLFKLIVMAELVIQSSNGNDVTTSLIVAQVFGKEHKNVVRDIENLSCSESFNRLNFERITYRDSRNREQTAYEMTKDGFSFLVMGYTGAKAGEFKERFISEFNRREMMLKDDDYILMRSQQILQKRVEAAEQRVKALEADNAAKEETIELQQKELAQAAPKVQYVDTVLQSVNTYATNLIAKEMGMSAETLNKRLKEKGIQYRQSGVWVLTSKYQNKGYTKTRTHTYTRSDGSQSTAMLTVWTEQGRAFLHSLFKA
jgi:Rha family phage regulatory protein